MSIKEYKNMIAFMWVTDMAKSLEFYAEALSCTKSYESEGWAELKVPGVKNAFLALNHWTANGEPPRNSYITLGVDDLDAFRAHLIAKGVHMHGEIKTFMDEGEGMRLFKFTDPDGNIITASAIEQ